LISFAGCLRTVSLLISLQLPVLTDLCCFIRRRVQISSNLGVTAMNPSEWLENNVLGFSLLRDYVLILLGFLPLQRGCPLAYPLARSAARCFARR
jgi:hypothetical protein